MYFIKYRRTYFFNVLRYVQISQLIMVYFKHHLSTNLFYIYIKQYYNDVI